MRPRAAGSFEPDERDQHALSELWHLSRTALAATGLDSREDRIRWVCDAFLREHGHEPHVAAKWIYVWAVDNLGTLTTGEPVPFEPWMEDMFSSAGSGRRKPK